MRVLALLFVLLSMPVLAADYTPWPEADEPVELLAQATSQGQGQGQGQGKGQGQGQGQGQGGGGGSSSRGSGSLSGGDYPGRYCCLHCRHNEVPCGGECISKTSGATCKKAAGCACPGKP